MHFVQSPLRSEIAALVICNGTAPGHGLLRRLSRRADLVLAADGGANAARRAGVVPDVIIGDLDSITAATRRVFSRSTILHVRRQDTTDLEKALEYLRREGVGSCVVVGATGRRLDFTLGNLASAWLFRPVVRVLFAGDGWWAAPLEKENTIHAPAGSTVSLIPWGNCSGVSLRGLRYPLTEASLAAGMIAVSNRVRRNPFRVTVRRGRMMLVVLEERGKLR